MKKNWAEKMWEEQGKNTEERIIVHHWRPSDEAKWLARYSELVCACFRLRPSQQTVVIDNSLI